jgi:hypothetical protein
MDNDECDETFHDDVREQSEQQEWFEDDCRQRTRDMQEYCRCP